MFEMLDSDIKVVRASFGRDNGVKHVIKQQAEKIKGLEDQVIDKQAERIQELEDMMEKLD